MGFDDRELIRRCLSGEDDAFRIIVKRHEKALVAFLLSRNFQLQSAEEIAQESFVRAYFSLKKLRQGKLFLPWLIGIALRVGREFSRNNNKLITNYCLLDIPDRQKEPKSHQKESLLRAVQTLKPKYKEIILLRFYADMPCSEIARKQGKPTGSITKQLSRAYKLLRGKLQTSEEETQVRK